MSSASPPPDYSPSWLHQRVTAGTNPRLAWRGEPVAAWQEQLRVAFRDALGHYRPPPVPLDPLALRTRAFAEGRATKFSLQVEPGMRMPVWWCLPHQTRPGAPVIVALQGHFGGMHLSLGLDADEQNETTVKGERDFARQAMRHGYACLCVEQRAFGERGERLLSARQPAQCHDAAMHALMLGWTLLAERLHDLTVAREFLTCREEADTSQAVLLGESAGGTTGLYAAGLDPHWAGVVCACGFCTFRDGVMAIGHCVENYVPGLLPLAGMADLAGLVAPRPLLLIASDPDEFYPFAGVKTAHQHLASIYTATGASDALELHVGDRGHQFYADLAWPRIKALWP